MDKCVAIEKGIEFRDGVRLSPDQSLLLAVDCIRPMDR
jgi:hypothetical protein